MKYFFYLLACCSILIISCEKKNEAPSLSLQGNWHTVQETWHKVYPENRSFSNKHEISKEFYSFKALEISDKKIKIIDPDGDYDHPYYTIEYDGTVKSNYIKIVSNGSDVKFDYILSGNNLTLKSYAPGIRDEIGSNYSYREIKLSKDN